MSVPPSSTTRSRQLAVSRADHWSASLVRNILTNEKYKGDALLRKSYITDLLTKKQVKNEGEVPQYYITGNHEPIITPAVWDFVQAELAATRKGACSSSRHRVFSGKVRCGQCGHWYGSKTWHPGTKYEKRAWRCNHKYDGDIICDTPALRDEQIIRDFLGAIRKLLTTKPSVEDILDEAVNKELDTTSLQIEAETMFARINTAAETINKLISTNARVAQNQDDYQQRFTTLTDEHTRLLAEYEKIAAEIRKHENRLTAYRHYKEKVAALNSANIEFTPYVWHILIDHAEVDKDGTPPFTFRDASQVSC